MIESAVRDTRSDPRLRTAAAAALGLCVPAMISGRAVLQGLAAGGLILVLVLAARDRAIFVRAEKAIRSRFGYVILAAFAGMAISIPGSLDPLRSLDAWARSLAYLGACVLFWSFLVGDERSRRIVLRVIVAATWFGCVLVLLAQADLTYPMQFVRNDFGRLPSNWAARAPKGYAAAVSCLIPVLLWIGWREAGRWRAAAVSAALLALAVIVAADNKSALAGLLAMILVVSFAATIRRVSHGEWHLVAALAGWLIVTVAAGVGVLSLIYVLPEPPPSTPVWDWMPAWMIDTHRQQIWHFTMGKIAEAPWLGYGMNCIDRVAGAGAILPGYKVEALPSHPHNWMLEILGETGLIGFAPVLLAVAWAIARMFLRHWRTASPAALAQLGLASVFWASSLFNFSIWSSWWLIGYFLLTAVIAAAADPEHPQDA